MKKTYLSPQAKPTLTFSEEMIASSNNYGQPEQGQNLGTVGETSETSGNLSRRYRNVWDDEVEMEEE